MKKNLTPLLVLFLFSTPQFCSAQDYLGSWTLDWSQVIESNRTETAKVSTNLESRNNKSEKNPIWVLSIDSLKVYQSGDMISATQIKWTKGDRFEIINDDEKQKRMHYIDQIENGKIKMSTGYSDSEIYLRRL